MTCRNVGKAHCDDRSKCIWDGSEFSDLRSSSEHVVHNLKEILAFHVSGDDTQCIDISTYEAIGATQRKSIRY